MLEQKYGFYPTPRSVIESMVNPDDVRGAVILEPSAGKGDIVDYLNECGARKVLACEIQEDLRAILQTKECEIIGDDFLSVKPETVSHIDMMVMNPPFNEWDKHLKHAWDIAPSGCRIVSLANHESVSRDFGLGWEERELKAIISDYGLTVNLGSVFKDAERATSVEIELITLYKPVSDSGFDFSGYFTFTDEEQYVQSSSGLLPYNEIRNMVEGYVKILQHWDRYEQEARKMDDLINLVKMSEYRGFGKAVIMLENKVVINSKSEFAVRLQKHCWRNVIDKLDISRFVTSGVMSELNKQIEKVGNMPFSMKNIQFFIMAILQQRDNIMNNAIVEAVDRFTRHTKENRFMVEGWKTNSGHLLGKKVIVSGVCEPSCSCSGLLSPTFRSYGENVVDLCKALCFLKGVKFEEEKHSVHYLLNHAEVYPNQWHEMELFRAKFFKKGTCHLVFKDEKDWELINRAYAKAKGATLPEKI